jgi:colanic acid biosynthesis glycosyl transferase WcaI
LGWLNKIVIMYAGIIGLSQNLIGLLAEIASIQRDDLLFVFIGEGPLKAQMEKQSSDLNLSNIQYYPHMPQDKIVKYMYSSDILLVVLREKPLFKSAIPSKFFDDMATGKPVISNVDGELREIMENCGSGLYFLR